MFEDLIEFAFGPLGIAAFAVYAGTQTTGGKNALRAVTREVVKAGIFLQEKAKTFSTEFRRMSPT